MVSGGCADAVFQRLGLPAEVSAEEHLAWEETLEKLESMREEYVGDRLLGSVFFRGLCNATWKAVEGYSRSVRRNGGTGEFFFAKEVRREAVAACRRHAHAVVERDGWLREWRRELGEEYGGFCGRGSGSGGGCWSGFGSGMFSKRLETLRRIERISEEVFGLVQECASACDRARGARAGRVCGGGLYVLWVNERVEAIGERLEEERGTWRRSSRVRHRLEWQESERASEAARIAARQQFEVERWFSGKRKALLPPVGLEPRGYEAPDEEEVGVDGLPLRQPVVEHGEYSIFFRRHFHRAFDDES